MKAVLEGDFLPAPDSRPVFNESADDKSIGAEMTDYYRYIDKRLADIEDKLDIRMAAMQRFQEQADARMERSAKEAETRMIEASKAAEVRMTALYTKADERMENLHADNKGLRIHLWAAALTAVLGFAGVAALTQSTVDEQGAWLRQSVDRIEQRIDKIPTSAPDVETLSSE